METQKDGISPPRRSVMYEEKERLVDQAIGGATLMDAPASSAVEGSLRVFPEHGQALSEDADILYALWLRRFAKATNWKSLPQERRKELAEQLHQEVAFVALKAECDSRPELDRLGGIMFWEPSKTLLELVGIPTDSRVEKEGKGKADERPHSTKK